MQSYIELKKQLAELEIRVEQARIAERQGALDKIKAIMQESGLTVEDLGFIKTKRGSSAAGTKVAPKYRKPETGETWSGRGKRPRWVQAFLADGGDLETLRIVA